MKLKTKLLLCGMTIPIWGLMAQTNLIISNGTSMVVSGTTSLHLVNTKVTNNGTFVPGNGSVNMSGDVDATLNAIEGSSPTTFYDLTTASTVDLTIGSDVTVNNKLDLQAGKVILQNNNITLESSGSITNANNSKYIQTTGTGTLIRPVGASSVDFPIGNSSYNPVQLQNAGTTDNYSVRVADEVLEDGTSGTPLTMNAVDRTWDISEAVAGGSDLIITANWQTSDELTAFDRTVCNLMHYTGSTWDVATNTAATGSNDEWAISRSGITSLSPFAVAGENAVLPLELLTFEASPKDDFVVLQWQTANEVGITAFSIEHSMDGRNFSTIGKLSAKENGMTVQDYEFTHQSPHKGGNYYRLKIQETNRGFNYSVIRLVNFATDYEIGLQLFPNPTSGKVNVRLENIAADTPAVIRIMDAIGRIIYQNRINVNATGQFQLDLDNRFVDGVYFLQVQVENQPLQVAQINLKN